MQQLDSELRQHIRYFADAGQRVYEQNRRNGRNPLKTAKAAAFLEYAEEMIRKKKQSPDAVCGQARNLGLFEELVCTKTLYNYIDQCILKVRNIDLPLRVKRAGKRSEARQACRQYGNSIDLRSDEVLTREEFGHWEFDTVLGTKDSSDVLLTMDERKTRQRSIQREHLPHAVFKSITADNGPEFAHLAQDFPDISIFFAHPYSAWERGTNENQNGLLRRFFPKGRSLSTVSKDAILRAQNWINHLPRKLFNYNSSSQLFSLALNDMFCPM